MSDMLQLVVTLIRTQLNLKQIIRSFQLMHSSSVEWGGERRQAEAYRTFVESFRLGCVMMKTTTSWSILDNRPLTPGGTAGFVGDRTFSQTFIGG